MTTRDIEQALQPLIDAIAALGQRISVIERILWTAGGAVALLSLLLECGALRIG